MTPERYRQAHEIFNEAVLRSEPERDGFVAQACATDPELRAEVQSLLEFHETSIAPDLPARTSSRPVALPGRPRKIWMGPVGLVLLGGGLSAGLLAALFTWTMGSVETELRVSHTRQLEEILDLRVGALQAWAGHQKERLKSIVGDPEVVRHVGLLARIGESTRNPKEDLLKSPSHAFMRTFMGRLPKDLAGQGYALLSPSGRILDMWVDELVGSEGTPSSGSYIRRALLGEFVVSRPYRDTQYVVGEAAGFERPVLFVGGPVREEGRIVALLALRFDASTGFSDLFRSISSDDVMAFDGKGNLVSELRDGSRVASLRDPGGDVTRGIQPARPEADWPLTRLGAAAISGRKGADSTGYRSLRGRDVVGAWTWLPEWEMGMAVERDLEEVLRPAGRIRTAFFALFGVVALSTFGLVFASLRFGLQKRLRGDTFGSYVLERRIGKGGMAEIYLAHHTLLKRPTAVKIIEGMGADGRAAARFEREARLASSLSHPNTIQIFDYGRTPDGRFYLAMEYLEGLNLAQLVSLAGPLPPARAIHLLRQVCGSLEEAHAAGLVHRDIKPANIMITRRGGVADAVKVLDFGIARSIEEDTAALTQLHEISGTPAYIAPERIRSPRSADPRSDLYAFGAVAFYMLTGRNVFEGPGPAEVLYQVMTVEPPAPSALRGQALPPDLDRLVLDCLVKDPERRPETAQAVCEALRSMAVPDRWGPDEARAWWTENEGRMARLLEAAKPA